MDVLVCHCDRLVADAIRIVLDDHSMRCVVAKSSDELIELGPEFDVCLIDIRVDRALKTIERLASSVPAPRVVALVGDSRYVRAAVRSGADGWATMHDGLDRLVQLVAGSIRASDLPARPAARPPRDRPPRHNLTAREVEVLAGLVDGESTKGLAARLNVTPATARTHVQNVLAKLGVHSRLQAVALVVEQSLLSSSPDLHFRPTGEALGA